MGFSCDSDDGPASFEDQLPLTEIAIDCIDEYEPPTGNTSRDLLCERAHRLTCLGLPSDHLEVLELCRMFNYENWGSRADCPVCG